MIKIKKLSKPRGFAAMSKEKQKLIASKGGKTAHKLGKAHQFTSEEAKRAGKIGGKKSRSIVNET
jgi:general stress protein YciG